MAYIVYKHTTPSEKVYIGITKVSVNARWRNGEGYIHNEYFYRAIKKYGWDNIKHEILFAGLTEKEAKIKEIELIRYYKSHDRAYGYNLTEGGDGVHGYTHSPESISKIPNLYSTGHKPWNTGKCLSEETKRKLSESHKGKPSPMKGVRLSEERRAFNAMIRKRPISQFDKAGIFIRHWDSAKDASISLKISQGNISQCCNKKRKSAGGYIWEFRKDDCNE